MGPACRSAKQTILCIDDDDDNDEEILCYEKAPLERSGYAVITASSAQRCRILEVGNRDRLEM